jgi:hypothetical protein
MLAEKYKERKKPKNFNETRAVSQPYVKKQLKIVNGLMFRP